MQQFRDLLKGWFGKTLLAIFILPFLFFGIEGIFSSNSRQDVAISVNGTDISKVQISRAIEGQRRQLRQQMGDNVNEMFLTDEMLKPRVEKNFIDRELIRQAAVASEMEVASESVIQFVRSMPQFQDENGEFSTERLDLILLQANMSKQQLFNTVQEGVVIDQLQNAFNQSGFLTEDEFTSLVDLTYQKRNLSHYTVKVADYKDQVEISEEDVKSYYDEHKDQFKTPEQVKINYVQLKKDELAASVEVLEEDIQADYDTYVEQQKAQETRRSSHILIELTDDRSEGEALARAQEAKQRLDAGESLEAIVEEYSDDFATADSGGDLDFAGRGIYDEAFEEALFGMEKIGAVSEPILTSFGYHIIQLTGVQDEPIASLEEKREELTTQIRDRLAFEKMDEAVGEMDRLAYESGDLSVIAETFDLKVEQSEFFTRTGGKGVTSDRNLITAAFSDPVLKENRNSEVIELASGDVLVLNLAKYDPPADMDFIEVDKIVRERLTDTKASELALAEAKQWVEELKSLDDLQAFAKERDFTWNNNEELTRQNRALPSTIVKAAFKMAVPAEDAFNVTEVAAPSGDVSILVLKGVQSGSSGLKDDAREQAFVASSGQQGVEEFDLFVSALREKAEIQTFD